MDITEKLIKFLELTVKAAKKKFNLKSIPPLSLEPPPKKEFGDLSTNIAMQLCKLNRISKLDAVASYICEGLKMRISKTGLTDYIEEICIKPPAFINIYLSSKALYGVLYQIQKQGTGFGKIDIPGKGRKAIVEFVSANPTGPLTVAHARQAAVGGAISNILEFFGWKVCREYYLNDEGNQIDLLEASIYARYAEILNVPFKFPEDGYQGDYIKEIAKQIFNKYGKKFKDFGDKEKRFFSDYGIKAILKDIKKDLSDVGIGFDNYTSQKKLTESEKIEKVLKLLKGKGLIYKKDGATWFKSTKLDDDKDRVLIKSDGSYTYIAPDIAYHKDKYDKGFDWLIDVWGPDHHGYIGRMKAAQRALGKKAESLSLLIVQLVTIYRAGKPAPMSTRKGEFITLRKIIDEVGPDVAKFFFLMRRKESHLDFDLELAKSQSLDNPVYYIQYAHARICGILDHSKKQLKGKPKKKANPELLKQQQELAILKKLREYPYVLSSAYNALEPYRIIEYLLELASVFHSFYTKHKVVSEDISLTQARLLLIKCVRTVISNALSLLGISQPEKM